MLQVTIPSRKRLLSSDLGDNVNTDDSEQIDLPSLHDNDDNHSPTAMDMEQQEETLSVQPEPRLRSDSSAVISDATIAHTLALTEGDLASTSLSPLSQRAFPPLPTVDVSLSAFTGSTVTSAKLEPLPGDKSDLLLHSKAPEQIAPTESSTGGASVSPVPTTSVHSIKSVDFKSRLESIISQTKKKNKQDTLVTPRSQRTGSARASKGVGHPT
jgi:hypothetical protein